MVEDYLSPKALLDKLRLLCRGKSTSDTALCEAFNRETKDGRDMSAFSELLSEAIASILQVKAESELDTFLSGKQMSFLSQKINGLDDFELICFFVIK